jgi:hypothetical protein
VNLERLLQLKKRDLADEQTDDEDALIASGPDSEPDDEESAYPPDPEGREQGSLSYDELLAEYNRLKALVGDRLSAGEYGPGSYGAQTEAPSAMTDQPKIEEMLRAFEQMYEKNPMHATAWLIGQAKLDAVHEMEDKIAGVLRQHRTFGRLMGKFFSDPTYAHLAPYQDEMEFLIEDVGLNPSAAAKFIQAITARRDEAAARRSAAAKAVRNRSAVESDGAAGEPVDKEKDLDNVLKKSKTLDEMFAGLSKLRL